ncbi:MAG: hypothetical protein JXR96_05930 [Deltaproteobacteria bacterium]|nr:hypothetical protein [Deltaproteobacteria bacterium]
MTKGRAPARLVSRWAALAVWALACLPGSALARGPGLRLAAPERVVGDGETAVVLTLKVVPARAANGVKDIKAIAAAGTIGEIRRLQDGTFQIELVPPSVAAERRVAVSVTASLGKRRLSASKRLKVVAPEIEIPALRSKGPLAIQAPARVYLGRDRGVEISLARHRGKAPRLKVSAGALSAPSERPDGRLLFRYTPPEQRFPQVAILAAADADGMLLDWLAIPLYGRGQIETETEAHARVVVRIDETVYGPFRADGRGRVKAVVEAPPGVAQGVTITTDRLGNEKEAPLDLGVPEFNRLLALCPRGGDRLLMLAVDERGQPDESARLDVQASKGWLSPPAKLDAGVYQSLFTVAEDSRIGEKIALGASLSSAESSSASCRVAVRGGRPAAIKLFAIPSVYVAGSGTPITLRAELFDSGSRPAQNVPLEFTAELGKVGGVHTLSQGKIAASLTMTDALAGKRRAVITARTVAEKPLSAQAEVELRPGRVSRLELRAARSELRADGRSSTVLRVRTFDAFGNAVPGAELKAKAAGEVGAFAFQESTDEFQASYTAPFSYEPLEDTIAVFGSGTDVEASERIALSPSKRLVSIGPRVGYATNLGKLSSLAFALDTQFRLPFGDENLLVGIEGLYYWTDQSWLAEGEEGKTSLWVLPLLARVSYQIPIGPLALYLGVAGGASLSMRETSSENTGKTSSFAVQMALAGHLGLDLEAGPGRVAIEAAYLYSPAEDEWLQGNLGGLLIFAGYRFEI